MKQLARTYPENIQQLFREIKELHEQYIKEVPSKRRQWPTSIRKRVNDLWRYGLSSHEIAAATALPAQTMYSWKSKGRNRTQDFLPIEIVQEKTKALSVQPPQLDVMPKKLIIPMTVTVVLPNGVKLEGLDADSAFKLARAF